MKGILKWNKNGKYLNIIFFIFNDCFIYGHFNTIKEEINNNKNIQKNDNNNMYKKIV